MTEYNLICDSSWLNSFLTSITFIGFLSGAAVGGYLRSVLTIAIFGRNDRKCPVKSSVKKFSMRQSDNFGRKFTFTLLSFLAFVQTLVLLYIPSIYSYAVMRIFQVGLMTGAYVSTQSYAIEIVGKDYKPMVACMICGIPSSIGYIAMAFRNFASN